MSYKKLYWISSSWQYIYLCLLQWRIGINYKSLNFINEQHMVPFSREQVSTSVIIYMCWYKVNTTFLSLLVDRLSTFGLSKFKDSTIIVQHRMRFTEVYSFSFHALQYYTLIVDCCCTRFIHDIYFNLDNILHNIYAVIIVNLFSWNRISYIYYSIIL